MNKLLDYYNHEYEIFLFKRYLDHVGHDIEVVRYGDDDTTWNVAIECETCGVLLSDVDNPEAKNDGGD